jgi:MFS family permease
VPRLGSILVSMQLARIAQSMVSVAIVLFALDAYHSSSVAGVVTFAIVFPGLVVSPIAGALLDRHGRIRLVMFDYAVACVSLVLIGILSLAGALPAALLVIICGVSSLTSVLSATGLRSLFPMIVPKRLWERVNAVDSNGYVIATILGPPAAAAGVAAFGGPPAIILIGLMFALAIVPLRNVPDPPSAAVGSGNLLRDAWIGLVYTWRNPTLRGLGFAVSTLNISGGVSAIVIPLLVIQRLQLSPVAVGIAFAASGVSGMVSAFIFGRLDTRGREWPLLVLPMAAMVPAVALLLPVAASPEAGAPGAIGQVVGFAFILAAQATFGLLNGPLDIALFTVRQRRTDPAILGRAFAVSMAFNFLGFPVGAALSGGIASASLVAAVVLGMAACAVGFLLATTMIPRHVESAPPVPAPEVAATRPPVS